MNSVSCINASDPLHAYYEVDLKISTGSCVRQVVNWHPLQGLENALSPEEAICEEDAKVHVAAAESIDVTNLRARLKGRQSLEPGRVMLRDSCCKSQVRYGGSLDWVDEANEGTAGSVSC
jgi:hypothetical protein